MDRIVCVFIASVASLQLAGGQEFKLGETNNLKTSDFSIVSPGWPGALTEATSAKCTILSSGNNTELTLTPDTIKLWDGGKGGCRERLDLNVRSVITGGTGGLYCASNEAEITSQTWTLRSTSEISIILNKCETQSGGLFRLEFTSTAPVTVICYAKSPPDFDVCPTTTTSTTTTTTTPKPTTQEASTDPAGTDPRSGQSTDKDKSDSSSDNTAIYIGGGIGGGVVLLIIIIILLVCLLRESEKKPDDSRNVIVASTSNGTSENVYENVATARSGDRATVDPEKGQARYSASNNNDVEEKYSTVDKSKKKSKGIKGRKDASVGD